MVVAGKKHYLLSISLGTTISSTGKNAKDVIILYSFAIFALS